MTLGDSIKKGVGMVHGTGEALRGEFNAAIDNATGDKASATKNHEIAQKGVDEWDRGYRGHALGSEPATGVGHNVPPTSTSTTYNTSTNAGPHNSNVANKLDPRIDSDADHRANPSSGMGPSSTAYGSSNVGHHSSNLANKADPRIDSDADHRNNPTSAAPGVSNAGHHQSNFANKLDPRVDSDMDHRADPTSSVGIQGHGAGGVGGVGSTNAGPHKSNLGNKLDPRYDSDMDNRANPASNVGGRGY